MLAFYKKVTLPAAALLVLTSLFAWFCLEQFLVDDSLQPLHESVFSWRLETITDRYQNGSSSLSVKDWEASLDYEYHLTEDVPFPYAVVALAFSDWRKMDADSDNKHIDLADLSAYSRASFKVKCSQHNIIGIHLHSFDEQATDPTDFPSYRVAGRAFSCNQTWSEVEVDLRHLQVPVWWLETYNFEISDRRYWLDKVVAISFDNSRQGPLNTLVKVKINDLTLHGYDWRYGWIFATLTLLAWSGYVVWVFRQYTRSLLADVKARLKKDRPLIAYQQLSIEPHKDKEKSHLLRFMATEYANPEMNMDYAIDKVGMNRTRINQLLKDELDLTFSAYIKKLRLAEAARLLAQKQDANISEIAYSVGYNNVSYFNRLFKQEYGCTPKTFRGLDARQED